MAIPDSGLPGYGNQRNEKMLSSHRKRSCFKVRITNSHPHTLTTSSSHPHNFILTPSHSRNIADSIRKAASECPDFRQSIPLNRDDETRIEAIERELGSQVRSCDSIATSNLTYLFLQTRADILQYSLVDWEELSGDRKPPPTSSGGESNLINLRRAVVG